ncbi:MAG TPA: YihY/virulence factor BrkB family protein [Chryseosolibacter sp.]|nr:YihY/virulence factor BrkB family protein [Chryseosolibacter sp.]
MGKVRGFFRRVWKSLKKTAKSFGDLEPFNMSIVIAYYTIFSLPGLLVIIVSIAGYFFGQEAVTGQVTQQIGGVIGGNTASDIEKIIARAAVNEKTTLASILGVATLLFGATGVFYNLQQIFNKIWEVKPKPKGKILKLVKDRVFSFGLILVIGFLLLVSLLLSAALSALSAWVSSHVSESLKVVFKVLDILVSLGVITLLFAAMFKFLPDAKVRWRTVWVGAVVTALLFVVAKFLLGLYFGQSEPGSTYGAAGTIVLIMLWVSYAGIILLFGGLFTRVYANEMGHVTAPSSHAEDSEPQVAGGTLGGTKKHGGTPPRPTMPDKKRDVRYR